jgi:hypothetical protein
MVMCMTATAFPGHAGRGWPLLGADIYEDVVGR